MAHDGRWATCLHEAAHAVYAYVREGIRLTSVSVDDDHWLTAYEPTAVGVGRAASHAVLALIGSYAEHRGIHGQGQVSSLPDLLDAEEFADAEGLAADGEEYEGGDDVAAIRYLRMHCEGHGALGVTLEDAHAEVERQVEHWAEDLWPAIEALAQVLYRDGDLDGATAMRIIDAARGG